MRYFLLGTTLIGASYFLPIVDLGKGPQGQPVEPVEVTRLSPAENDMPVATAGLPKITTFETFSEAAAEAVRDGADIPATTAGVEVAGDMSPVIADDTPQPAEEVAEGPSADAPVTPKSPDVAPLISADASSPVTEASPEAIEMNKAVFAAIGGFFMGNGTGSPLLAMTEGPTLPTAPLPVPTVVEEEVASAPSPAPDVAVEPAAPDVPGFDSSAALAELSSGGGIAPEGSVLITSRTEDDGILITQLNDTSETLAPVSFGQGALRMETNQGADIVIAGSFENATPLPEVSLDDASTGSANGTVTSGMMQVSTQFLNMREGPSSSHPVVTGLTRGQKVEMLDAPQNGWVQVRLDGSARTGWVFADYLTQVNGA